MTQDSSIRATNKEHLIQLIGHAIQANGPNCDLNHLDVSGIFLNSKFNGDLSRWQVRKEAKCQQAISSKQLGAMPKPSFFHWERALRHSLEMPWEWNEHFCATLKTAKMLGMSPPEAAVFIQEQWLWNQQVKRDPVQLPELDL